ncbi:hypothetical protein A6A04_19930 [Paramagnetospirillum marisnigri]|uniref:Integrase DNA-binding domain-containing protein n=1 Tax=Paramagnetospirillum marisnigri TaxID=1285242 RepID=A0A178MJC3_9PROT|nr:Arm DNA-binding domain-containing protein [Paramagnetospirillum marisnigri]OAN48699.1 hypothetical protein A6A04_19930 [Paramagnetospirillum marisnigri]
MPKITKKFVDSLTPDLGRELSIMDDSLTGFGIRIKPTGAASYFIRYKLPDGAERRMVLGKVGTLTPDEARKLARDRLADVAKGTDPSGDRHSARSAPTVTDICEWYLAQAEAGQLLGRHDAPIKRLTLPP